MGDQQGVLIHLDPAQAIERELARIVRIAERTHSYQDRILRAYSYKIMREAFPEIINRERWRAMAGKDPDASMDATEQRAAARQREADVALLREHRRALCCPECDRTNAEALRRELGLQEPPAPVILVAPDEDDPEDEPCAHEYTSACEECDGRLDRECDHDYSCPNCERCEAIHNCRECGADRDCYHIVTCDDCGTRLREPDEYGDLEPY
jgi:hypothetical protein